MVPVDVYLFLHYFETSKKQNIRHVLYCVIEQRYALNRLFISFLQKYFHLSRPSHLYKMHVAMRYVIVVPTVPFHNSAELALN